jgi:hypothetical protein
MPGPNLGFTVITGPEWLRVLEALGRVDRDIPDRLQRGIRDIAEDVADVARGRALGLPTPRNAGHTGLRAKVAEGVSVENQGNGGVRVTTSMPTRSEGIIPRGLDRVRGWRHPLFGDKRHWYSNPGYDWFLSTFSHSENVFESKLHRILEEAADDIADAAS